MSLDFAKGLVFQGLINDTVNERVTRDVVSNANNIIAGKDSEIHKLHEACQQLLDTRKALTDRVNRGEDTMDRLSSERNAALRLSNKLIEERYHEKQDPNYVSPILDPAKVDLRAKQLARYEAEEKEQAAKRIYTKPDLR